MTLTADKLRRLLDYDPVTGEFTWLKRAGTDKFLNIWNARFAGKLAGRTKAGVHGYLEIAIDNKHYRAHRLAWLYMTGEWPKDQIDHINCIKTDNRFANLREASAFQNMWNTKPQNKCGLKGVTFNKNAKKYTSQICVHRKRISLGYFDSALDAHNAYVAAAKQYHKEFSRTA